MTQKTSGPYELILPEEMDHNEFNLYEDFLEPITNFLKRHNLLNLISTKQIDIKPEFFEVPDYITDPENLNKKDMMSRVIRKMLKI